MRSVDQSKRRSQHKAPNHFEALESRQLMSASPLPIPAGSSKLTGNTIGTVGSYKNQGNSINKALDGNPGTFFDAPTASGSWVGLDLGAAETITQVQYLPRGNFGSRMVGGTFQASSTPDFSSNVVTLFTVSTAPSASAYSASNDINPAPFRYVRYLSPTNGSCNVAEIELDGIAAHVSPIPNLVTAVAKGPTDVNITWHYDGDVDPTSYTIVRWQPLDTGVTVLGDVTPGLNSYEDLTAGPGTAYSYSVIAMNGSDVLLQLSESFVSTPSLSIAPSKLTGNPIGTSGSYRNLGSTIAKVFDGNNATFFDAPASAGSWVGLDLGSPQQITQINYLPRGGFASRMLGGVFQASSSADFSTGTINLFTVSRVPSTGALTNQPVSTADAYQYVRYLSPANSYCNVAELQFFGGPAGVVFSSPAFPASVSWSNGAPSPIVRAEAVGATVNGKVYVFGGFNNEGTDLTYIPLQSRCDSYDPASNTWTRLNDFPEPFTHSQGVVVGTNVWFVGGYVGNHPGPGTTHVWIYDTVRDSWSRGIDLPQARGAGASALVGNTIYFTGGMDATRTIDETTTWSLDLKNQSAGWIQRANLPNGRNHVAAASIGGYLYVVGGQHGQEGYQSAQSQVDRYDAFTDTWQTVAPLPTDAGKSHVTSATFAYNGRIIVVGGETGFDDPVRNIVDYDPATNTWNQLGLLPAARSTTVSGIVNGRLVVTTGNSPSASTTTWVGSLGF